MLAVAVSFMILGGFLMLPITFLDDDELRLSRTVVGIFAVAILTAGFACTGLLAFAVRNPLFQADSLFAPALTSSALGLLTIFYNFLVNTRYTWTMPAFLLVAAAAVSSTVYAALLLHAHRRIARLRSRGKNIQRISQLQHANATDHSINSDRPLYQDPAFYDNYVRNMFPASSHHPSPPAQGYDPSSITEEEMQRQQMLMLLLQKDYSPSSDPASGATYHIDWQGRDDDDAATRSPSHPPHQGPYAPPPHHRNLSTLSRQLSAQGLQPWDGVWRSPAPMARGRAGVLAQQGPGRGMSPAQREQRRRQIEMGQ